MIEYFVDPGTITWNRVRMRNDDYEESVTITRTPKTEYWYTECIAVRYQYNFAMSRQDSHVEWRKVDWKSIPGMFIDTLPAYKNQRTRLLNYMRAIDWFSTYAKLKLPQPIFEEIFADF